MIMWNTHRMRANRNASCPSGIPDDLYFFPEVHGMEVCYNYDIVAFVVLVST